MPISQVYETAERFADGMGDLDKAAFRKAMKRYMPYLEAARWAVYFQVLEHSL